MHLTQMFGARSAVVSAVKKLYRAFGPLQLIEGKDRGEGGQKSSFKGARESLTACKYARELAFGLFKSQERRLDDEKSKWKKKRKKKLWTGRKKGVTLFSRHLNIAQ